MLGLEIITQAEGRHVFFRCGDGVLLLFNAEATEMPPAPTHGCRCRRMARVGHGHLCFAASADEIDRWKAQLQAQGIAIEADFEWPNGGRSIYFRDPSGNSLEFAEPRIWGL